MTVVLVELSRDGTSSHIQSNVIIFNNRCLAQMFVSRRPLLDESDANSKCHITLRGISTWHITIVIDVTVVAYKQ